MPAPRSSGRDEVTTASSTDADRGGLRPGRLHLQRLDLGRGDRLRAGVDRALPDRDHRSPPRHRRIDVVRTRRTRSGARPRPPRRAKRRPRPHTAPTGCGPRTGPATSRPSIEFEIRIASGRTRFGRRRQRIHHRHGEAPRTRRAPAHAARPGGAEAPRGIRRSAARRVRTTISATGVPTDAAAPSRPAALFASSPDGSHVQQHENRIVRRMSWQPSSHQPVLDQELGELLARVALVDDLHARRARRLLGEREDDRPRRRVILRLDPEVLRGSASRTASSSPP